MNKYWFTLPATFNPMEFLPEPLEMRADDARWLVSQIVHKVASRDLDEWGMARLDSRVNSRVMHKNTVPAVIKALENGAIEVDHQYSTGHFCKGYRLNKRFLGVPSVRRCPVNPDFIARVERERQRMADAERGQWLAVHSDLEAEQRHLTIISGDAYDIVNDLPDDVRDRCRLGQSVLIDRLIRHEHYFSPSPLTGRVFNDITGLKRELRAALRLHGEPLGHVDIRCAQPALLALWMSGKIPPNVP